MALIDLERLIVDFVVGPYLPLSHRRGFRVQLSDCRVTLDFNCAREELECGPHMSFPRVAYCEEHDIFPLSQPSSLSESRF